MTIKIGVHIEPKSGSMSKMRDAWMEAEALGADSIFTADHFFSEPLDSDQVSKGQQSGIADCENFESTAIQAAMAATTTRPQIGCTVHAIGFRNPNLLADIARTIDHISNGRYILGLGSGYFKLEYDEYGYPFPSQKERLLEMERGIKIIRDRFEKLNPKPVHKIPIMVGSMGDKIGLRIVAEQADIWHMFGSMDKVRQKYETFLLRCEEAGRNPDDIEIISGCLLQYLPDNDPDVFYNEFGIKHLHAITAGPDWDLGPLKELLQWRDALKE